MELTKQQTKLLSFVTEAHKAQVRKYTGEPYTTHLVEVAGLVHLHGPAAYLGVGVALCHDLLEDTEVKYNDLFDFLLSLDYSRYESDKISNAVYELTNQFTPAEYPHFNRALRKEYEAERYSRISNLAKTVKLADLISNTKSIVANAPKFARVYLQEKFTALEHLKGGEHALYVLACATYYDAINQLQQ